MQRGCTALIPFTCRCSVPRHSACRFTSENKNAALAMSQGGVVAEATESHPRAGTLSLVRM